MSDTLEIMTAPPVNSGVEIKPEVIAKRDLALTESALIGRVQNTDEQTRAVAAQKSLHEIASMVEKARKALKEPVIKAGKEIDAVAAKFLEDVKAEELRIATLVGNFQEGELAKARALEALRLTQLGELEEARQKALSEAATDDERDRINAEFCEANRDVQAPKIARVEGQVVKSEWEINVTDVWALARNHSSCVKIEPRMSEIRSLLDAGFQVAGVTAKKIVKASVRTKPQREAIAV